MNETLKRIGLELRRYYSHVLHLPLNWRMIDAVVKLEEAEEQKAADGFESEKPEDAQKVVRLRRRQ